MLGLNVVFLLVLTGGRMCFRDYAHQKRGQIYFKEKKQKRGRIYSREKGIDLFSEPVIMRSGQALV